MDDNDVIVIDTRNAVRTLPGILARPPTQAARPPVIYMPQPSASSGAVYVRDPATGALVRESAGGAPAPAAPASKLAALGTGKLVGLGVQVLALLMPLPSAPSATGDIAKDVRNGQLYAAAVAQAQQRYDRLNTIGALIGQVV